MAVDVPWLMRTINRYKYGRGMHTDTLHQGAANCDVVLYPALGQFW